MDNRKWDSGASGTPPTSPASPSVGYPTPGDPSLGIPATKGGAFWFHQIGEELRSILTWAGLTPDSADLGQVAKAIDSKIPKYGKNYALNGMCEHDQNKEGGVYTSSATEIYSLDNWRFAGAGATGVFTLQRGASTIPGVPYCIVATVATQQAALAAADNFHIEIPIDGGEFADFGFGAAGASPLTVSFWVNADVAGTYPIAFMEGTNSRFYVSSVTLAAGVDTLITKIIPGDVAGTWQTAQGTFGIKLLFSLGVGANWTSATQDAWQAGAKWNTAGTVQLIQQAAGTKLKFTKLRINKGTLALEDPLTKEGRLEELQAVYWKSFPVGVAVGQNAGLAGAITYTAQFASVRGFGVRVQYPRKMRSVAPVITTYNPEAANEKWRRQGNADSGIPAVFNASSGGFYINNPQVAADIAEALLVIHVVANARLGGG
jgi:hypothetical protein